MKRITKLPLGLFCLTLLLSGCGASSENTPHSSNHNTPSSSNDTSSQTSNTGGETPSSQSSEQPSSSSRISLPTNCKFVSTFSGLTGTYESYKIGNEFMFIHRNDITYGMLDAQSGMLTVTLGTISGGSVDWDSDTYVTTLYDSFEGNNQGFIVEYSDTNSYLSKYCTKGSDTKTIAGVSCVLYTDSTFDYEYWMDESSMLCYESKIGSYVSQVSEVTTSISSLPYAAPNN